MRIKPCQTVFFIYACRYGGTPWPVGQEVKTPPFHGGIAGSIPARVTKNKKPSSDGFFIFARTGIEQAARRVRAACGSQVLPRVDSRTDSGEGSRRTAREAGRAGRWKGYDGHPQDMVVGINFFAVDRYRWKLPRGVIPCRFGANPVREQT